MKNTLPAVEALIIFFSWIIILSAPQLLYYAPYLGPMSLKVSMEKLGQYFALVESPTDIM